MNVTLGGTEPKPAREYLAGALDALPFESVWSLSHEPSWGYFVIAIQGVVNHLEGNKIQSLPNTKLTEKKTPTCHPS